MISNYEQFVEENYFNVYFVHAWPEIEGNYDAADMTEELLDWICYYDKEKEWGKKKEVVLQLTNILTEAYDEKYLCMTLWNLDRDYFQYVIDRVLKSWWEED